MPTPHVPVDPRFIPTLMAVKDAWMAHFVAHANVPEKIERELGFEVWLEREHEQAARQATRRALNELANQVKSRFEGGWLTTDECEKVEAWIRLKAQEED